MRVAVLANLKKNAPHDPSFPEDMWADLDSEKTVESILAALRQGGHEVVFFEGDPTLQRNLERWRPDICFNFCEGHFGDGREAQVPAILEMMRIPYTGSKVLTLALTLDKPMTKRVLAYHGLPTPPFQVFDAVDELLDPLLAFPLFVKPSREGTGMGISPKSIVRDESELRAELGVQLERYREPILVERFIDGREVTLGVLGNVCCGAPFHSPRPTTAAEMGRGLRFLPPLEVNLAGYDPEEGGIYSHRLKVDLVEDFKYFCPAPLDLPDLERLQWLTAAAFRVTGSLDVARVDFRLDALDSNRPYILEVNPLPGMCPGISDLVIEAEAGGLEYVTLVNLILEHALQRYGMLRSAC
jgi:D-alanine-D-alanine ligase